MKHSLYTTIPSDVRAVEMVCAEVRRMLLCHDLETRVFSGDLLLREFVNNAVFHGNRCDPGKTVRIGLRIGRQMIGLRVSDEGPGFDWRARQGHVPGESDTSGRGMAIGKAYARCVKYNCAGNSVMLAVARHAGTETPERKDMT